MFQLVRRLSPLRCLAFALLCFAVLPVLAAPQRQPQMASAAVDDLSMRTGPGTRYEAHWTVGKGYPFRVIGRKGNWLHVRDFENDKAWVYRSLTNSTPHRVVKATLANLRRSASTASPIVARAAYGEVLRILQRRGDWLKVRHQDGAVGWVASRLTWGW
jgi:SH3-like domain-containing protein